MTVYSHAQDVIKPPKSPGTCFICKEKVAGDMIENHLHSCLLQLSWSQEEVQSLLIRVMDKNRKRFWLIILAGSDATLMELDGMLRNVWVGCCDHLSVFLIGDVHFSSDGNDEDMNVYIRDVLQLGDECMYRYDFGSNTILRELPGATALIS